MWRHVDISDQRLPDIPLNVLMVGGALAGFGYVTNQVVIYNGIDNNLHALVYEAGWRHVDLGAHFVRGAIAAYRTPDYDHIVYHGPNDEIHMLMYTRFHASERPRHVNLSVDKFRRSIPAVRGAIAAYSNENLQRILYHGSDGNIHLLKYGNTWEHVNLTGDTFRGVPAVKGAIATYRTASSRYVLYHGVDDCIHMLIDSADHLNLHLDRFPTAPPPLVRGPIAAYARGDVSQHVVYHGVDDALHMLMFDSYRDEWRDVNVTDIFAGTARPLPVVRGSMAGYMTTNTQHVLFRGVDDHIHSIDLYIDPGSDSWIEDVVEGTVDAADAMVEWGGTALGTLVPEPLKDGIEKLFNLSNTLLGYLLTPVEWLLSPITSFVGMFINAISALPVVGRFGKWAWEVLIAGTTFVINLPDFLLTWLGIMATKKMRLLVLVQQDVAGPVATPDDVETVIRLARSIFWEELRIKILPARQDFSLTFSDSGSPAGNDLSSYWKVIESPSVDSTLDVCCEWCAFSKDLGAVGSDFEGMMLRENFWGNGGRAISLGAPVVAFTVRSYSDGKNGCSLGPLTDYVTILLDPNPDADLDESILAHELGHACNIIGHSSDRSNLMFEKRSRGHNLTVSQKMLIRSSRHVTWW